MKFRCLPVAACLFVLGASEITPAVAQQQSVKPGINKNFENPDVERWIKSFEREGRDIYDKRHEIVAACELKPGMAIADVGAGTGLFVELFSRAVGADGRVYAVDIAEEFVQLIRKRSAEQGLKNVTGIVCSADDAKLPESAVDVVFLCDVYHHLEFPQKTLATLHRALKPDGRFVLIDFKRIEGESSEWTLDHVRAGQEVFRKEIEEAGFRLIDEKSLSDEKYQLRFQRVDR
jgi:predicted methyltransferase